MSSHAWLDSLSEDWPSVPNSLRFPPPQRATDQNGATPESAKSSGTKIPRPRSHTGPERKFVLTPGRNNSTVLNERTPSDVNIPPITARRTSSKPSHPSVRGHRQSNSLNDFSPAGSVVRDLGSVGSVVHNISSSPEKINGDTPEWKRRLLYGKIAYGEQRDLFTSAANGLEDIFKQPESTPSADRSGNGIDRFSRSGSNLPSSPPVRAQQYSNSDTPSDDSFQDHLPRPAQSNGRAMNYKPNDELADISQNSGRSSPWSNPSPLPQDKITAASSQLSPHSNLPVPAEQNHDHRNNIRIPSSQSAADYEDFSPILIERHSSEDGKIDFAPVSLSATELKDRLEKLQNDRVFYQSSEESGSLPGSNAQARRAAGALQDLNSFINLRRGGRSHGSSQLYTLTPALGNVSDMLPEDSLQASTPKQFPSIRDHGPGNNIRARIPSFPAAPYPSPEKDRQAAKKGDNDLKLFGPYDTFTNQTLLRRISQFEDPNTSPSQGSLGDRQASAEHLLKTASRASSGARWIPQNVADPTKQSTRSFSQFGAGELDDYAFNEDFTRHSNESDDGSVVHHSVSFSQGGTPSPPQAKIVVGKRRKPESTSSTQGRTSSTQGRTLSRDLAEQAAKVLATPHQQDLAAEYKRHRTSPSKNPTPKRRRTLHQSDIAFGAEDDSSLFSAHGSPQQVVGGRKRKDARAGDVQQTANADVLASRQMLRPRTPTPSQGSIAQRHDRYRPSPRFLQKEIAKLKPGRKPSIKTEDFLHEAHRIMDAIRGNKSGPQSGLTSLEEPDEEHMRPMNDYFGDDASIQDSTRERLSRPPSRDGKPLPRMARRQEDPKVVNHLRKYQELSDMDDIIATSLRSLGVSKEDIRAVQALERNSNSSRSENSEDLVDQNEPVSDPPNIIISENPLRYEHSTAAEQAERFRDQFPSNVSGSESGFSSVRTGSSRGSDTRKTIAPESVSHLIPDQVGSMLFDKVKGVWLKKKQHATRPKPGRSNTLLSENSEDDVFADIPDLTVDVSKEMRNLRLKLAQQSAAAAQAADIASQLRAEPGGTLKSILINNSENRSAKTDSRSPSRLLRQFTELDEEDVEDEINHLEDSSPKRRFQVGFSSPVSIVIQDVPVPGSPELPEASVVEPVTLQLPRQPERKGRRQVSLQPPNGHSLPRPRNTSGAPSRQLSVQGQAFIPRPVSVIVEQDEDSRDGKSKAGKGLTVPGDRSVVGHDSTIIRSRQTSLNIVVSATPRPKPQPRPENAEIIGHYVGNMSLSPLPDFTPHQERSYALEVSYVLGDHNLVTGDGTQMHMTQAVRNLVDKIAEVEAFEPFWEDMREIELRDKKLGSLHMLDRFCSRLVRLNASHNAIRALDGIPTTVRELTISRNLLSDLTSWDRLMNLQYVDISNNEIRSLSSFRNLVHLRELVANNTGLVNLDGINYHETLLTVTARGNAIQELDFEGTGLQRLTTLHLEGNKIQKIENLHELSSLSHLCLKGNRLTEFAPIESLPLKHLVISDNKLKSLDLTAMPHLHLVYADRNRLTTVTGLRRARHLDSLSLREQGGSKPFDLSMLNEAYEVRKLFLSGNRIGSFSLSRDFLNLQTLDLANCGLQHLPDDLGQMLPNLRVLNLNFNGLADISGLMGIARLKRLHLAGNRFATVDLKSLIRVLADFPWLTEVDLRGTPLTHGFYPSMHAVVRKEKDETQPSIDPFKLTNADVARDATFCGLLDMDTRIERRTYERKLVRGCKQLQQLDGLPVNKRVRHVKDIVWKTMVERGLLLRPDGSPFDLSNVTLEDDRLGSTFVTETDGEDRSPAKSIMASDRGLNIPVESTRWEAEASFA